MSFLHALLCEGLVIDREVAPDGVNVFVKILSGFERLCVEAEREKLQVALQVHHFLSLLHPLSFLIDGFFGKKRTVKPPRNSTPSKVPTPTNCGVGS